MRYLLVVVLIAFFGTISAQKNNSVQFYFKADKQSDTTGTLTVKAVLNNSLQLFSVKKSGPDDPFISSLTFDSSSAKEIRIADSATEIGKLQLVAQGGSQNNYRLFSDSVSFLFPLHFSASDIKKIKGEFVWLGKKADEFPNGTEKFSVDVSVGKTATDKTVVHSLQEKKPVGWTLFFICVLTGFLAVFTPCVFPLIPVTVSFFLKKSKSHSEGVKKAWWYTASIILIYAVPTLILTLIF